MQGDIAIYAGVSEDSHPLELLLTRAYSKPRLLAQPSPVLAPGRNVTLQCISKQQYDRFILIKEGPQKLSWIMDSQYNQSSGQFEALFSLGSLTPNQIWTFRCYSNYRNKPQVWSEPSDPLELLFSGPLNRSIIQAEPGSVITLGSPMTIWCQGIPDAEIHVLHKVGSHKTWGTQTTEYSFTSTGWSDHSDILEMVVTREGTINVSDQCSVLRSIPLPQPSPGEHCDCVSPCYSLPSSLLGIYYSKPSLSVLPSPVVTSGGNMTLQCVSWWRYEKFILTKDDQKFLSSLDSQYIHSTQQYQAFFSIDHVTPDHTGTFRCYGYYKNTPHLWSVPSDPLEIHISDHILEPGKTLTLQFCSGINYERFDLYKMGELTSANKSIELLDIVIT
ncbi:hypothetical protein A6R68_23943, partial [Neotoma lepida]